MSWQAYIDNLTSGKALEFGAIIGADGNLWASNFGVAALAAYETDVPLADDPEKTKKVHYDEKAMLIKAIASKGITGHEAGFRINNQKYYTVQFDEEAKTWYLKKNKGGACIALTNAGNLVFGSFSLSIAMDNAQAQNAGECNKRVIEMAKYLSDSGY